MRQDTEISTLRSEVSRQAGNILQQRSHSGPSGAARLPLGYQPRPPMEQMMPNGCAPLGMQQENAQQMIVNSFPPTQQPRGLPKPPVMTAYPADQGLHSLAYECFAGQKGEPQSQQHQQGDMPRQMYQQQSMQQGDMQRQMYQQQAMQQGDMQRQMQQHQSMQQGDMQRQVRYS